MLEQPTVGVHEKPGLQISPHRVQLVQLPKGAQVVVPGTGHGVTAGHKQIAFIVNTVMPPLQVQLVVIAPGGHAAGHIAVKAVVAAGVKPVHSAAEFAVQPGLAADPEDMTGCPQGLT